MGDEPADDLESLVRGAVGRLADDDGRLWGYSASPRWILADSDVWWLTEPVDGAAVTGRLWRLTPDPAMGVGNTSVEWRDRTWAMIDCAGSSPTVRLLLHEAFHAFWEPEGWDWVTPVDRGDDSLALPQSRAALRTELRAWARALRSGDRGAFAIANAIRRWRIHDLAGPERSRQDYLDLWEGMAEYSAWKWTQAATAEVAQLADDGPPAAASWHRSFCYTTGPVLGWALDVLEPDWRNQLRAAGSLTALLEQTAGKSSVPLRTALDRFGYNALLTDEAAAHEKREAADAEIRGRFTSLVWLPFPGSIWFDPRGVRHWGLGTFYRSLSCQTERLQLKADEGAIVTPDWKWIGLPSPNPRDNDAGSLDGPGWMLTIADPAQAAGITWGPRPPGAEPRPPESADPE
ncbi:MAG: hypothetical protein J2P23_12430 [Microlunatus sp.]|nr:hypothetical protein [Microlunatus sp.]